MPGSEFYIEVTFPVVCGDRVLFAGISDLTVNAAIYAASSAGIEVVANMATPMPGSPGETFLAAQYPVCRDGRIYFNGGPDVSPPITTGRGIYAWQEGSIEELLAPEGVFGPLTMRGYNHVAVGDWGLAAAAVLFFMNVGYSDAVLAVPAGSASPQLIAEGFSTLLPGRQVPPETLNEPVVWGNGVAFKSTYTVGATTESDIHRWSAEEGFARVADTRTLYPGVGNLGGFESLTVFDAGLAFSSLHAQGWGIFLAPGDGRVLPWVVRGDRTVDGQILRQARQPRGHGRWLSFLGRTEDAPLLDAVFVKKPNGEIERLLGAGDVFEGATLVGVLHGAGDGYVAINAELNSPAGARVIYRAAFPEGVVADVPVAGRALAVLVSALAMAGLWLLRRPAG